ncbi:hypothetical protein [Enterococcus sp. AZ109]|uniref:hypothetical protein n=1 Tax=Enterococcus sp. AZ109 TaxID=2774634 RepID=UPI003F28C95E
MYVFKVTMKHVWGKWRDFTFVTAATTEQAIIQALKEIKVPDKFNDKVTITVAVEGPAFKNNMKRGKKNGKH